MNRDSFLPAVLLALFIAVAVYAFVFIEFRVPQRPVDLQNHLDWWADTAPAPLSVFITLEAAEGLADE